MNVCLALLSSCCYQAGKNQAADLNIGGLWSFGRDWMVDRPLASFYVYPLSIFSYHIANWSNCPHMHHIERSTNAAIARSHLDDDLAEDLTYFIHSMMSLRKMPQWRSRLISALIMYQLYPHKRSCKVMLTYTSLPAVPHILQRWPECNSEREDYAPCTMTSRH
jgi:hypothetical protein